MTELNKEIKITFLARSRDNKLTGRSFIFAPERQTGQNRSPNDCNIFLRDLAVIGYVGTSVTEIVAQ